MKKKVIFWSDNASIQDLLLKTKKVREIIQAVVGQFSLIGIEVKGINQISGLVTAEPGRKLIEEKLNDFVFNSLFPETPAGFNRDKFKEMIDLPLLTNVVESFVPLGEYLGGGINVPDVVTWDVYSIYEGKVGINETQFEKLKMKFQGVAETQQEQNRLKASNELCVALNNLVKLAEDEPRNYGIKGVIEFDEDSGEFKPARTFVKNGGVSSNYLFGNLRKAETLKSIPKSNNVSSMATENPEDHFSELAKARNQN